MVYQETPVDLINLDTNVSLFCYRVTMTTSTGMWFGDHPDMYALPLLLTQITLMFLASTLVHSVLRHLGQPVFISQLVAGVLLGPSVLGRNKGIYKRFFAAQCWEQQHLIGILGYMLFLFMIGVKADISMIPKTGKKAVAIAIFGTLFPMAAIYIVSSAFTFKLSQELDKWLIVAVSQRWSLTAYVNLACVLNELNLLTSKIGRLAMSASLIAGLANLFISAIFTAYVLSIKFETLLLAIAALLAFISFFVFLVFVIRPFVLWLLKRTPEGALLEEGCFVTILLIALGCGLITEMIGYSLTTGPFMLGLLLPGGAPLGTTIVERLEQLVSGIFLPVFLVGAGVLTDFASLKDASDQLGYMELLFVVSVLAKFIGVVLPCLYCKMPLREAVSLGIMMNIKGINEVDAAWRWQESELVNGQLYTMTIVSIIVIGGTTARLVKYLYRPEDRFVTHKRRTIQHARHSDELRILACIHNQDNVSPIITLLEASSPSLETPICVYLLHLVQLLGRADAVLIAHQPKSSASAESTHIVNAFQFFEQQHLDSVSVLPYICISPYASMHDDICSLALDKKVTLIILPFHLHITTDGTTDMTSSAVQTMNVQVLLYAPCSVGILVDHGLSTGTTMPSGGKLLHHVAVYFIGGADDREALAYATRMAEDPAIGLTLVRFLPPEEDRTFGESSWLDNEMVQKFQHEMVDGRRVVYQEEVVKDGEGTVSVIREMSSQFSLLVVGRREGQESPLTAGMSMWSEYPELGVIGDLLAATDFGSRVSTLVVQQQVRVGVEVKVESPKKYFLDGNHHQVVVPVEEDAR